jgi:hypothetical protein
MAAQVRQHLDSGETHTVHCSSSVKAGVGLSSCVLGCRRARRRVPGTRVSVCADGETHVPGTAAGSWDSEAVEQRPGCEKKWRRKLAWHSKNWIQLASLRLRPSPAGPAPFHARSQGSTSRRLDDYEFAFLHGNNGIRTQEHVQPLD